jgi:hypothetical protein
LEKTSGGFKDLLKEKCPWHLDGNHTTEQCYNSGEHSGVLQSHRTLMARKVRRRTTEAMTTSRNPTRQSTSSLVDYPADGSKRLPVKKS